MIQILLCINRITLNAKSFTFIYFLGFKLAFSNTIKHKLLFMSQLISNCWSRLNFKMIFSAIYFFLPPPNHNINFIIMFLSDAKRFWS